MRGHSLFFQDLESTFKETTSLLSLEMGKNEFYFAHYVSNYQLDLNPTMGAGSLS